MKSLKRIGAVVTLTISLGVSALAGEIQSPPCGSNDPGETHGPPCATDSAAPGQTATPPDSTDYVITQVAVDFVESVLKLF